MLLGSTRAQKRAFGLVLRSPFTIFAQDAGTGCVLLCIVLVINITKYNLYEYRVRKFNTLRVVKEVDFGMYLDGGEEGEILLPSRYVPENCKPGDELTVFIYLDNEERLVATTLTPLVQVGEFACLEVAWINQYGAFLNWGLMKDLFVPFREQKMKMQVGKQYVIHAHLDDESYRIVASAKVDRYLSKEKAPYEPVRKSAYLSGRRLI